MTYLLLLQWASTSRPDLFCFFFPFFRLGRVSSGLLPGRVLALRFRVARLGSRLRFRCRRLLRVLRQLLRFNQSRLGHHLRLHVGRSRRRWPAVVSILCPPHLFQVILTAYTPTSALSSSPLCRFTASCSIVIVRQACTATRSLRVSLPLSPATTSTTRRTAAP